ncbi:MAG: fibronectin type III domain-containing protein, partial [Clostridia bacterium]|nr:fibronectin type III domain-containing protein [Clostridia bacterium]
KLEWSESFGATEYEIVYGKESGKHNSIPITVSGNSYVVKNLKNGTPYYFVVRGKNSNGYSDYSNEIKAVPTSVIDANVIYNVDCGSNGVNAHNTPLGVNQSIEDQAFGKDQVTAKSWGYTIDGTPWASGDAHQNQSVLVANLWSVGFEGNGIHYSFELENGNYIVELTFYDEWKSKSRITDVYINESKVLENYKNVGEPQTLKYMITVEDGVINIDIVGGLGNNDNIMISGIIIKKV